MKLTFPDFSKIFDTEIQGKINSLIIESRPLLVRFLSDINKIIGDVELDFKYGAFQGETFDNKYNEFLKKLIGKCEAKRREALCGSSQFIKAYIEEIRTTTTFPQKDRFTKLHDITTDFIKKAV